MQITITGQHIEVTPAIKKFTEEKLATLERHFVNTNITSIHIIYKVEKMIQIAEATVHFAHENIFASAEEKDLYTAIDLLIERLKRQIQKYKEKREKRS